MTSPSDQLLAEQVRQGNEQAFVRLIRRYERTLVGLIRYRVGSGDQVQDVLQETLVHAWSSLRRDTPRDVRAWLLQVARNRCRDYFRSTQRRELFVDTENLAPMVNRFGVAQARQREAAADIVEAMEEVPDRERAALRGLLPGRTEHCRNSRPPPLSRRHSQAPPVARTRPNPHGVGRHPQDEEQDHERQPTTPLSPSTDPKYALRQAKRTPSALISKRWLGGSSCQK